MKRVALIFLVGLALGYAIHLGLPDRDPGPAPVQEPVQVNGGQAAVVPDESAAPEQPVIQVADGLPSIRGRITDERGQALPGVQVHPRFERRELGSLIGRIAALEPVKTGADGRYAFAGSSGTLAGVYPVLEGYDFWLIRQDAPGANGTTIEWNFLGARRAGGGLEIHIYYPDGAVADRAELEWTSGTRRHRETWLVQDGSRKPVTPPFGESAHEVQAFLGDGLRSDKVPVEVRGNAPRSLELRLEPIPGISGALAFPPTGEDGAGGVEVYCARGVDPEQLDPNRPGSDWRLVTVSAGRPEFDFKDLEDGEYLLVVPGRGKRPDVLRAVTVRGDQTRVELALPPLTPRFIRVEVPDPKAIGVAGMSFSVYSVPDPRPDKSAEKPGRSGDAPDAPMMLMAAQLWTGTPVLRGAGSYEIPLNDHGVAAVSALSRKVVVVGTSLSFGSVAAYLPRTASGALESLTLRFEQAAEPVFTASTKADLEGLSLIGRLVPRGKGLEALLPSVDGKSADLDGGLRFPPVQPGTFELQVRMGIAPPSGDPLLFSLAPSQVKLASGPQNQLVPLPRRYPLLLAIEPRKSVREVVLNLKARDFPWTVFYRGAVPDGSKELIRLPAGKFALRMEGVAGIMHFQLPSEGVLRFAPEAEPEIRVVLTAALDALTKAGFQEGDVVVGDVADRFGWTEEAASFIDRIRTSGGKLGMMVRRGPETVVLEVDMEKMTDEQRKACFVLKE